MSEEAEETEEGEAGETPENKEFAFDKVGEKLAAERKAQGLDLTTIAERTRVPIRHLEAIERSDFAALPGSTYTLGFARSYARSLGLDAVAIGSELRSELSETGHDGYQAPSQSYEPTDPARVPPKALAWTAAGIAGLLLVGYLIWRSVTLDGGAVSEGEDASATAGEVAAEGKVEAGTQAASNAPTPSGAVVLTATDTVWLRIYDAGNNRLFEKEMQEGESYTVPADANDPMINTGRAQSIEVTIGGQRVDPLGPADLPILDVGVSAEALLARENSGRSSEESSQ